MPNLSDQLQKQVLQLILDELQPGQQLPSEPELSSRFKASRSSVREALRGLELDGVVYAVQGKGRFVSQLGVFEVDRPITRYESATNMLTSLGYRVTNSVLEVTEDSANERESELLGVTVGEAIIRLIRLRFGCDEPLIFSINTILKEVLPGPVQYRDWSGSITDTLAVHGHLIESSAARITAANLPKTFATKYGLGAHDPWLLIEESCVTRSGQRVLYSADYHRSDHIAFNVLRRR